MVAKKTSILRNYSYAVRGRTGVFEVVFTSCTSQDEAESLARQYCEKMGYAFVGEWPLSSKPNKGKSRKNGGEARAV